MEILISNVKLSCKIRIFNNDRISFNTDNLVKHYNNFSIVKSKYVYTVFTKTKILGSFHINITKIPSLEHVPMALNDINSIINENFSILNYKIENLTCLHNFQNKLNLVKISENFNQNLNLQIVKMHYNPEKFPGMFLSIKECTILIFSSGKMVVIGAANEDNAKKGLNAVYNFINQIQS